MAYYERDGKYIRSRDFTRAASVNLESMYSYIGNEEDYGKNFEILCGLLPEAAKGYVEMIFLDTVCFNMDRHTRNYGVLRESATGKVIGLAPNFDNNQAYLANPNGIYSDGMLKLYMKQADSRDYQNRKILTDEMKKYPYLKHAYEASLAYLK